MNRIKMFSLIAIVAIFSCSNTHLHASNINLNGKIVEISNENNEEKNSNNCAYTAADERDIFFSLAAYAVVYSDWQTEEMNPRGHNIGGILVNKKNVPVAYDLNSIAKYNDGSQHGEVRLMQNYIKTTESKYLEGYTIYTTLEPCAMCSGMMCLLMVSRCVYGQTDGVNGNGKVGFGDAIERLKLDSKECCGGGHSPYPRTPQSSDASKNKHRYSLDDLFLDTYKGSVTDLLLTKEAESIYEIADTDLRHFKVKFEENKVIYDALIKLLPNKK